MRRLSQLWIRWLFIHLGSYYRAYDINLHMKEQRNGLYTLQVTSSFWPNGEVYRFEAGCPWLDKFNDYSTNYDLGKRNYDIFSRELYFWLERNWRNDVLHVREAISWKIFTILLVLGYSWSLIVFYYELHQECILWMLKYSLLRIKKLFGKFQLKNVNNWRSIQVWPDLRRRWKVWQNRSLKFRIAIEWVLKYAILESKW